MFAASVAASTSAIRQWADSGGTQDLLELMNHAFDSLRAELAGQALDF
jgi:hypothetical protein